MRIGFLVLCRKIILPTDDKIALTNRRLLALMGQVGIGWDVVEEGVGAVLQIDSTAVVFQAIAHNQIFHL